MKDSLFSLISYQGQIRSGRLRAAVPPNGDCRLAQHRCRLEEQLGADAKGIHIGGDSARWLGEALLIEVLKLNLQVRVQVPVDSQLEAF